MGPDSQLEGRGNVENTADSWLKVQGTQRACALQGEGLQDGGGQEEDRSELPCSQDCGAGGRKVGSVRRRRGTDFVRDSGCRGSALGR